MSDYRAVAATTATLRYLLAGPVSDVAPAASVTTDNPDELARKPLFAGVNLFLFRVGVNPTVRNNHLPSRGRTGEILQRPALAVDLYYLLTFYGPTREQLPQILLGRVASVLNALGIIPPRLIEEALVSAPRGVVGSDLGLTGRSLHLTLIDIDLETIARLWTSFFQTPYVLSMVWKVSVVSLDGPTPGGRALPVRSVPHVHVLAGLGLQIRVLGSADVAPGSGLTLHVVGLATGAEHLAIELRSTSGGDTVLIELTTEQLSRLRGEGTLVLRVPDPAQPHAAATAPGELRLSAHDLAHLRAGPQIVRFLARRLSRQTPSNACTFVLRPVVTAHEVVTVTTADGKIKPRLRLHTTPSIGQERTRALLNELGGARAVELPLTARNNEALDFDLDGVDSATWLVRVRAGVVASELTMSGGVYASPTVEVG